MVYSMFKVSISMYEGNESMYSNCKTCKHNFVNPYYI